jgi:hypothetical protein
LENHLSVGVENEAPLSVASQQTLNAKAHLSLLSDLDFEVLDFVESYQVCWSGFVIPTYVN